MKKSVLLLALVFLATCGDPERGERRFSAAEEARASAGWMARAVASGEVKSACGSPAASAPAAMLVLLNTRQALSCRDAGFLLRRLQVRSAAQDEPVLLVVPSVDTAAVCRFLSEERVHLPVVAASAREKHPIQTPVLALAYLHPRSTSFTLHHGLRGVEILASLTRSDRPERDEPSSTILEQGASR